MFKDYDFFIETEVPEDEVIISRTNLNGVITYANETFAEISGYKVDELIGKPHNILRHPDMPKSAFEHMWETIKSEKIWKGYVKNLRKDSGYYWVFAEVSGVYKNSTLVEYKSIRTKVDRDTKIEMQNLYDSLKKQEENISRSTFYLSNRVLDKLSNLAKEQNISEDKLLNKIVESN